MYFYSCYKSTHARLDKDISSFKCGKYVNNRVGPRDQEFLHLRARGVVGMYPLNLATATGMTKKASAILPSIYLRLQQTEY